MQNSNHATCNCKAPRCATTYIIPRNSHCNHCAHYPSLCGRHCDPLYHRRYETAIHELQQKNLFAEGQIRALQELVKDADAHRTRTEEVAMAKLTQLAGEKRLAEVLCEQLARREEKLMKFVERLQQKTMWKMHWRLLKRAWGAWRRLFDGQAAYRVMREAEVLQKLQQGGMVKPRSGAQEIVQMLERNEPLTRTVPESLRDSWPLNPTPLQSVSAAYPTQAEQPISVSVASNPSAAHRSLPHPQRRYNADDEMMSSVSRPTSVGFVEASRPRRRHDDPSAQILHQNAQNDPAAARGYNPVPFVEKGLARDGGASTYDSGWGSEHSAQQALGADHYSIGPAQSQAWRQTTNFLGTAAARQSTLPIASARPRPQTVSTIRPSYMQPVV
jgi:hypothetical protein